MKSVIGVSVAMVIAVVAIIIMNGKINTEINGIIDICERIDLCDDVEQATSLTDDVVHQWSSIRGMLFAVLHHSDIDSVDLAMEVLLSAVEAADIDRIKAAVDTLAYHLGDLLDTEQLSLENIL